MVFDKILFAITIKLKIFLFTISIILTSFNYSTLAIIIISTIYSIYPRSPTTRVYVATGGNIISNLFLIIPKCKGNRREPSQRMQCASVAVL